MINEKRILEQTIQLKKSQFADNRFTDGVAAVETLINTAPKVGEWIPVSEGLPKEDYDTVLVFLESNIYDIAIWHSEYGFRPWYAGYFEEAAPEWESKVLAWQPLPEPYKENK